MHDDGGDGVIDGHRIDVVEPDQDEVGLFADGQGANLAPEAHRFGAPYGGCFESSARGLRSPAMRYRFWMRSWRRLNSIRSAS